MANTRNALIIANNEYVDDGLSRLRAPAHDAESLGEVLRSPDIGAFDVRTLLNAPAHEATWPSRSSSQTARRTTCC